MRRKKLHRPYWGPVYGCWGTLLVWLRFSLESHKHLPRCPWGLGLDTPVLFLLVASKLLSHDFFLVSPAGGLSVYSTLLFSSQAFIFEISLVIERLGSYPCRETMKPWSPSFRCHIILPHKVNPAIRLRLILGNCICGCLFEYFQRQKPLWNKWIPHIGQWPTSLEPHSSMGTFLVQKLAWQIPRRL